MKLLLIVLACAPAGACKGDKPETPPAPKPAARDAPAPGLPPAFDAGRADAAAFDAAPVDAVPATMLPLRIGEESVGALTPKMPIDLATLTRLVPPTYKIETLEESFEGNSFEVWEVKTKDGATLLRVTPNEGVIDSLIVFNALPSDLGITVGTNFAAASAKLGPFDCELSYHDDPLFALQAHCTTNTEWVLIFDHSPHLGEGAHIPTVKQTKLLGKSSVEAMVLD